MESMSWRMTGLIDTVGSGSEIYDSGVWATKDRVAPNHCPQVQSDNFQSFFNCFRKSFA